jgi:hypothetical protein
MKLLSVILLAIVNFCLIRASPGGRVFNGDFIYDIYSANSNECSIYGLDSGLKNAKEIVIPEFFTDKNGKKYYVVQIEYGAFSNSKLEKVTFNPSSKTVKLDYFSFYNNKNLRKVIFNHGNFEISDNAFNSCKDVDFDGSGVPAIVERMAKALLEKWNLPIGYTGYEKAGLTARNKKMADLYKLAKKIKENFDYYHWNNAGFNLPAVFIFRSGSSRGINMAYRELAKHMGVDEKRFLCVADGITASWNYVILNFDKRANTWFNVDPYYYDFSKNDSPSAFFMTDKQFVNHLVNNVNPALPYENKSRPDRWWVYTARYGTENEGELYTHMLIDNYIKQNNLGGRR